MYYAASALSFTLFAMAISLIDEFYGYGKFGTKNTHKRRALTILRYFDKTFGIKKLTDITLEMRLEHVYTMMTRIEEGTMSVATAHNYTTTLNTLCFCIFKDNQLWLSAVSYFGPRNHVRDEIPQGMNLEQVLLAHTLLKQNGHPVFANLLLVIRCLGLRVREAVSTDYKQLLASLNDDNQVRILHGTKGGTGKYVSRYVPVPYSLFIVLTELADMQGDSNNVIPADLNRYQYMMQFTHQYYRIRHQAQLGSFHDLRACKACEWFEDLTGMMAPVFKQGRVSKKDERAARLIISKRLGHSREDITNAYLGGKKDRK